MATELLEHLYSSSGMEPFPGGEFAGNGSISVAGARTMTVGSCCEWSFGFNRQVDGRYFC